MGQTQKPEPDRPASGEQREGRPKASVREAVLGFLTLGPQSGYDIKRAFDRTIGYAWNAYDSQIYTELRQMEVEGLVKATSDGSPRKRRVYHLTDSGSQFFDDWLRQPLGPAFTRDEFLLRLYFFHRLSPPLRAQFLQGEIDALTERIKLSRETVRPFEGRAAARDVSHPLHWQLAAAAANEAMMRARRTYLKKLLSQPQARSRSRAASPDTSTH